MKNNSNGFAFTPNEHEETLILRDSPPCDCVLTIFGATGDLARAKIFPALYGLAAEKKLPERFEIIGFSHTDRTGESFREQIRESVRQKIGDDFAGKVWQNMAERLHYVRGDFSKPDDYRKLADKLAEREDKINTGRNRLFYLATASHFFPDVVSNLQQAGLTPDKGINRDEPWTRLVIEKPFGSDLDSARELNRLARKYLAEVQIFRVDHYLAKETVQNILIFRFANSIFEPVWNRMHIDFIEISATEDFGVESRGAFYDKTGVVRDVVQNHILQVLALVAMESPSSFAPGAFHAEKRKFFQNLRPLPNDNLTQMVLLGQYKGYRREQGVEVQSTTPTFAALKVFVDNWRWQNVPFYIRAGKSLEDKRTTISIHFRSIPTCLFGERKVCRNISPNVLTLRIQPDEGIALSFACKKPGDHLEVARVDMNFTYAGAFKEKSRPAYQRLLLDCMRGDQLLFAEAETLEEQWKFVAPLLDPSGLALPVQQYEPGSRGPAGLEDFFADSGTWNPQ